MHQAIKLGSQESEIATPFPTLRAPQKRFAMTGWDVLERSIYKKGSV